MTKNDSFRFVAGGPVPSNSSTYIIRKEDRRALQTLQGRSDVSVVGPRQVGKTSLLHRIHSIYERDYQYACVLLDLSTQNDESLDWEQWSKKFCERLVQGVRRYLDSGTNINNYPKSPPELIDYLTMLMRSINTPGLLILLDEASAIPHPIRDSFYSNIRYMQNDRVQNPTLAKIIFVFAGVFDPERLVSQRENSPFNSSTTCRLKDFTFEEVDKLTNHLHDDLEYPNDESLSGTVHQITGGQPYLTQSLLSLCADEWQTTGELNIKKVKGLETDLKDIASININHVVRASTRNTQYREFLKRLFRGDKIKFIRAVHPIGDLELQGALTEDEEGFCKIRNNLYQEALQQSLASVVVENNINMSVIYQLIDAFLECHAIEDRNIRDRVVNDLPPEIRTSIMRNDADKADVAAIVSRCSDFEDGIKHLVAAVHFYEKDSIAMKKVKVLLQL